MSKIKTETRRWRQIPRKAVKEKDKSFFSNKSF
jgi:hypothetical protein